jgi:Flp pilus assembly protein TadG
MKTRILASFRNRFARDERGISAVEFALVLPVLIIIYLGSVELNHAITIDRKLTVAGSSVGDLVAQGTDSIPQEEMDDIFKAAQAIMQPYTSTTLKVVVSSVAISEDGDEVTSSCAYHSTPRAKNSAMTVPDRVRVEGTTLVITEVEYEYIPVIGKIITESLILKDTFYMRPRQSDVIALPC